MEPVITHGTSLKPYNTFGIDAKASSFATFSNIEELTSILDRTPQITNRLILGGGSNILFTHDFDGIVLKNEIRSMSLTPAGTNSVLVHAGAGIAWHDLVIQTVSAGLWGLENMAMIPGTCGAAPVQNIGAYGVELAGALEEVEAFNPENGKVTHINNKECRFGYRESIFKHETGRKLVIIGITLRLSLRRSPNLSYPALKSRMDGTDLDKMTPAMICDSVMKIRTEKLPDPAVLGNAGSFFKNPSIGAYTFAELAKRYPSIPSFPQTDDYVKIPAGWLIEQCGWKGRVHTSGRTGCYSKQALILVNLGGATGLQVLELAEEITSDVRAKFGLTLEKEVKVVGTQLGNLES